MASLGTLSVNIGARTNAFTKALDAAQARASAFGKGVTSSLRSLGSIGGQMGQLLGVGSIGAAAVGMVKMAADAETLSTQFRVLTGSAETTEAVMGDIQKFAAETPFESMEIADSAKKLLAFGSSSDTVVNELRMLGDIAAGVGVPLGDLSEIYGKARVQGRLFAEDINQLQGRGIPVVQALASAMGVGESEIRGLVESGKIGFPQLQQAMAGMVAEGGDFNGMMGQLSQTTAGRFSTLTDNLKMLGIELGEKLLPYINAAMQSLIDMAGGLDGVGESFGSILDAAATWFVETRNYFEDLGVIAGTVIGNMDLLFEGLFSDIPNYAKAALDWVSQNTQVMLNNIATGAQNMWAKLEAGSKQLGEEIAFALGMSDEVLQIPEPVMQQMQEFQGFQRPEASAATQSLAAAVDEQLRIARELRSVADVVAEAPPAAKNTLEQVLSSIGATAGGAAADEAGATAQAQQRADFAQAAMRGSTEAYSIIANAMRGEQSPVVKATKDQTKVLQGELQGVTKAIHAAPQVQLLGSFAE
jgi:tape measure domain-containing protein